MDAFVIALDEEGAAFSELVKDSLAKQFNDFYEFTPNIFLVASDDLTADVARAAGIKGEHKLAGATGAVFKIGSYSGLTHRTLWEWLSKVDD